MVIGLLVLFLGSTNLCANEKYTEAPKEFLVAKVTKDYNEAAKFAHLLSERTNMILDFRGLSFNSVSKLSESKDECEAKGTKYPCYKGRALEKDSVFVSVEYSNGYNGINNGNYIVVAATGRFAPKMLKKVKNVSEETKIYTTKIYKEFMH